MANLGDAVPARATRSPNRAVLQRLGLSAGIAIAAMMFADWAYFKGFDNGADASLCVFAMQHLGTEEAMKEPSCKAIRGLTPPPRIFPGRNGDEPTVWNGYSQGANQ